VKFRSRTLLNGVFIVALLSGVAVNGVLASRLGLLGDYGYGPTSVPSVPTAVQAASACESTQVVWSLPASDGGTPVTGYVVRVREGLTLVATDSVDSATFTDTVTGLTDGTTYSVTVAAVNAVGEGPESEPAVVIPLCTPSKPLALVTTAECGDFAATWAPPLTDGGAPITGYIVWVRNDGQLVATDRVAPTQLQDTISTLTNGTDYTVTVSAVNSVGVGPPSDPSDVTLVCGPSAPSQPIDVIGSPVCGGAQVSWDPPLLDGGNAVTGYVVWVRLSGQLVATDLVDGGTYTDAISGLVDGTSYDVTVAAVNVLGVGPESSAVQVVPECSPSAPTEPLDVVAAPLCSAIAVNWDGPASDGGSPVTGYAVFVRSGGTLVATDLVDGGTFTDTISGLTDGTTYDVTVAGVNENGVGPESADVQIAPDCAPTVPADPADVSATPLCSALEVDWNPPTSDGASPITGYTVFVRNNGTLVATDVISDPNTFTDSISGLTDGTTYSVSVAATNAIGTGPESDPIEIAPDCPVTIPDAPVSITATPACEAVNVGWNAPANDGGSPITNYTVFVRTGSQTFTDTVNGSTFSDTIPGLGDGTSYSVTVLATNTIGDSSESSPPVTATPVCVPAAPLSVTAAPECEATLVGWNAPATDGGSPVTNYTVVGSTFSDTLSGLTDGTTYTVTVAAQNAVGAGLESSPPVSVTPVCVPTVPLSVTASPLCESVNVGWNAPASDGGSPVTGYTVVLQSGIQVVATHQLTGTTRSDVFSGLTDGTPYSVTVTAANALGSSATSSPVTVTPVCAPSAPLAVTASARCAGAVVGWNAPATLGGAPVSAYTLLVRTGTHLVTFTVGGSTLTDTISGLAGATTYAVTVEATNVGGTSVESSPPVLFTTTCVAATLHYVGPPLVRLGLPLVVNAQLSSPLSVCRVSQPIVFSLDRNPITQAAGPFLLTTVTTDPGGLTGAHLLSTVGWQPGHYTVTAAYPGGGSGSFHCAPATDSASLTAFGQTPQPPPPPPHPVEFSSGSGLISANGSTVFRFTIGRVQDTSYRGSFVLLNGTKWRMTGALSGYSVTGGVSTATGSGELFFLNRFHAWQPAASGVPVVFTFTPGAAGVGTLGIQIAYTPVPPQPGILPNTSPVPLTGGNIQVH
jgi:Fibronectin type III domain